MTDKDKKAPQNELEYLIDGGSRDLVSIGTLWQVFLRSEVYVLCDKDWDGRTADPTLKTLIMAPGAGAPDLLAVFTSPPHAELAKSKYADYPKLVKVPGALALHQVGGKLGLAVNPGGAFDMQMAPDAIDKLKDAFGLKPLGAK
jgi:hypothetical protein